MSLRPKKLGDVGTSATNPRHHKPRRSGATTVCGVLLVLSLVLSACAAPPAPAATADPDLPAAVAQVAPAVSPAAVDQATIAAAPAAATATPTATQMPPSPLPTTPTEVASSSPAAEASPSPAAASPQTRSAIITHEVQPGETLSDLAEKYGVTVETIVQANGLADENDLTVGQQLRVPPISGTLHRVAEGDTVESIAALYNVEAEAVVAANGLADPNNLAIDQELLIPGGLAPSRALVASRSGQRGGGPLRPDVYVVQPGDTLAEIADRYGITVETLLWANRFGDPDLIVPGTELVVLPVSGVLYTVQEGDTLGEIAQTFKVAAEEILMANGIDDPNTIQVGVKLLLPGGAPLPTATPVPPTPTPKPQPTATPAPPAPPAAPASQPAQPAPAAKPAPAAAAAAPAPAPAGLGAQIVAVAREYLGYAYVWGGTSPSTGFDCTGFVYYVVNKRLGKPVPRDLFGQLAAGTRVDRSQVQAGDLVFFQNTYQAGLSHVGIALDNSRFIHAASERYGVIVSNLTDAYWSARWYGATRVR